MEDDFGGSNDRERRLRRLLITKHVRWTNYQDGEFLFIQEKISNDQAQKLGQFLLDEHHQVTLLFLRLERLTATRFCEPLLRFIQDSPDLEKTTLFFDDYSAEQNAEQKLEIAGQFLQAVAGSTIQVLQIRAFGPVVPKESFLDLVRETTSISKLKLSGDFARNWPTDDAIENAFVENTTVKTLELYGDHSALVTGIIGAMKRSPTIEQLTLFHTSTSNYSEFSRALSFFSSLRRLKCTMWPDSIHDAMMEGFKRNCSLVEFSILSQNTVSDIDSERIRQIEAQVRPYLERNRGIRALIASPMVAPQGALTNVNFIPLICPATKEAFLHNELVYSLLMANPQMFQLAPLRR